MKSRGRPGEREVEHPIFPELHNENVDERQGREEVPETDIQGAIHAVGPVEDDEERHGEFGEMRADPVGKAREELAPLPDDRSAKTRQGEEKRYRDEDDDRERLFDGVDDGEVVAPAARRNLAEEVVRVAARRTLDDHQDAEGVFRERPSDGIFCRPDRGIGQTANGFADCARRRRAAGE